MRNLKSVLILLALCFFTPAVFSVSPVYEALREMTPDGRRVHLEGATLERDAFRFVFENGTLHMLTPVEGRDVAAIYIGTGHMELAPATPDERHHLQTLKLDSGLQTLENRFEHLLIMGTDSWVSDLFKGKDIPAEGGPDPAAVSRLGKYRKLQRKEFLTNFDLRLLQDLLSSEQLHHKE